MAECCVTVVLGIVGSIIGGAVTHLFYPPSEGGRFHPSGLIVSMLGAIMVLYPLAQIPPASTARVEIDQGNDGFLALIPYSQP